MVNLMKFLREIVLKKMPSFHAVFLAFLSRRYFTFTSNSEINFLYLHVNSVSSSGSQINEDEELYANVMD